MADDIDSVRTRLSRLERQALMLQTGRLDWLVHVPRDAFLGPWAPDPSPFATRLKRELEVLSGQGDPPES